MLSPSVTQSIDSLQAYYWKLGFADEWSRRLAKTDEKQSLEPETSSGADRLQRAKK
jgi:hypothetical protein